MAFDHHENIGADRVKIKMECNNVNILSVQLHVAVLQFVYLIISLTISGL